MATNTDITAAGGTTAGSVTATEQNNIASASVPVYTAASVNSTTPILVNSSANPGSVDSLKQPDGTYRLEITGVDTGTGTGGGTGSSGTGAGAGGTTNNTNTLTPGSNVTDLGTIFVTAQAAVAQQPLANPLHDYDSYTYNLSLHLMNIADFNNLVDNPVASYSPVTSTINGAVGTVLVASAGRYQGFARNYAFTEDFYFDNFRMTSYINTTQRNRNSNLIECSFTIIEPNGFTFINRLMVAADSINGATGNYIKMPYLLQIDFFGHKDGNTAAPISGLTKYIPITLIEMKSKVTAKGTEYAIKAAPFNHQAFNQANVVSPADFIINAKTVQDVFGLGTLSGDISSSILSLQEQNRQESDLTKQLSSESNPTVRDALNAQLTQLRSKKTSQVKVSGYADALNSWWDNLQKSGTVASVNKISVVFDPEIGQSRLFPNDTGVVSVQQVAVTGNSTTDQKAAFQSANGAAKSKLDFNAGVMSVPAGTSIDTLIDWAVRNSDYITKQMKDKSAPASQDAAAEQMSQLGQPLKWYRIVPKVKITSFDPSTNLYTTNITYYVKTWTVHAKHPQGPLGRVPGYVKDYQYIYTGQNKDILDMQIDFNMMYFVQTTAARNTNKFFGTAPALGDPQVAYANDGNPNSQPNTQPQGPTVIQYSKLQPVPVVYSSNNIKNQSRSGASINKAITAGDVKESIQNDARGDMINVKLKIIGDPHFIKQDDIFYNQSVAKGIGQLTPNGSLYTDNGELYVNLLVRFPVDYDESSGLAIPANSQYNRSEWSGIYKIIKVDSEFNKGKFEQTLDLVKLSIPDELLGQNNNVQARLDTLSILALGQTTSFAAARFTGPNILQAAILPQTGAYNSASAALQNGANAIKNILQAAATKAISTVVSSVAKKASDATSDWFKSHNPFKDEKYVEGTDSFVGPMKNIGGVDYTNAPNQTDAETARLSMYNSQYSNTSNSTVDSGRYYEDTFDSEFASTFEASAPDNIDVGGGFNPGSFDPSSVPIPDAGLSSDYVDVLEET